MVKQTPHILHARCEWKTFHILVRVIQAAANVKQYLTHVKLVHYQVVHVVARKILFLLQAVLPGSG